MCNLSSIVFYCHNSTALHSWHLDAFWLVKLSETFPPQPEFWPSEQARLLSVPLPGMLKGQRRS